jgi:hypothetical protein
MAAPKRTFVLDYEADQVSLTAQAHATLQEAASAARASKGDIVLTTHGPRGPEADRRTAAMIEQLVALGVDRRKITTANGDANAARATTIDVKP